MSTTVEKISSNKVKLSFDIDAAKFDEAMGKAYIKVRGQIAIPGFRKGHAPRKMIENMYGEGVFYDEAFELIFDEVYGPAIDENKLEVVDRPQVDIQQIGTGKNLQFTCEVFVKPDVTLGEYKGLKAERESDKVTDADVETELNAMADRNARMGEAPEGAKAEMGDTAVIDYEGFVGDVAFEGGKGEDHPLSLGSGQFIPGFEEGVVGHKVGESFDVNVTFPTEYHSEELAGKDATFKVTIKELKRKELPTLDDEFAKDVSEFDTLEELKKDLTEKMAAEKKDQADSKMENDLLEQAVKNMTVEIPTVMFENKAQDMVEEFGYRLQTQGMNMDMYMKYTGTTPEALTAQFMPQAEAQVRTTLLLEKIAEVENIEITEEDINGEYDRMVKDYGMELDKVKSIVPVEEIKRQLTIQKAAKVITDSAVVTQL